jgi:hypothetical protein
MLQRSALRWAQVLDAAKYLGTPEPQIVKPTVPGGHIGLFIGARTLKEHWLGCRVRAGQGKKKPTGLNRQPRFCRELRYHALMVTSQTPCRLHDSRSSQQS